MKKWYSLIEEEESISLRGIRNYKSKLLLPTICKQQLSQSLQKGN
jgi:hypothetical protein